MITSQSRTVHVDSFRDTRFRIKVIKDLRPTSFSKMNVVVAEWLRRWTRNPLGSPRAGSNPADYEVENTFAYSFKQRNFRVL